MSRGGAVVALAVAAAVAVACGAPARSVEAPAPAPAQAAPVTETAAPATAAPPVDEALIASDAALERPFLYLATKGDARVHVLGTVHLGIQPARLPPVVWDALDAARVVVVEADTRSISIASFRRTDGTTLDAELGPAHWAKLEATIGRQLAAGLRTMKTSMATVVLTARAIPMTTSIDDAVRSRAENAGIEVAFLETGTFQSALLDKWLDVRGLRAMLDDLAASDDAQRRMLTAYARGDDAALAAIAADRSGWAASGRSDAEFDEMTREILLDRNAAWIAPIEGHAAAGPVFVAVGAAHLFGAGGVLELLEARGWRVERVVP